MRSFVPGHDDEDFDPFVEAPTLTVELTEPQVLGYLLGPDREPIATFVDRRTVPFGFHGSFT